MECARQAYADQAQVELSSTNTTLLKGSSSGVPYLYAASPYSFSSYDSASVATSRRASYGSAPTNRSGSSLVSCSTTCISTPSLKPQGKCSSADLKRIRPSQRRAFLEETATTEPSASSIPSIEEIERVNRCRIDSQNNPELGAPMRSIGNLDTLHRMLQSVSKSWSASNAASSTTSTRSEPRVITPVPSNSKALQPKDSRKAPSALRNCTALQQTTSVRPAPLPSRPTPPHIHTAVVGMGAIENPLKEAVAKLESPMLAHPRKNIGSSGNNSMPPPPPPDPLPSKQQSQRRSTSACDLSNSDMSFELAATGYQMEPPCKPIDHTLWPVKKGDVKDAEDSYDDLSFVDVDGVMDVDLDEQSNSSPSVEQHVPCTTQESTIVPRSQPASSGRTQERSVASAVQDPEPVITRETFSPIFSTPTQVAPFAPSPFAPKALGMRRVHSGPISGHKTSNTVASASGAKPGTAPPCGHSSTRGPKPFKVPWAHNSTSVTTLEPSVVPGVRKPVPNRRGVMDLDTTADSSFSFDDMDLEEVEQLLSQIGA